MDNKSDSSKNDILKPIIVVGILVLAGGLIMKAIVYIGMLLWIIALVIFLFAMIDGK